MSDFIIIKNVNNIPNSNYQDFQNLDNLATRINSTCGVKHKYIGMHLSERILYLTYYIKYSFRFARCYKIDIQIEKGSNGKCTGDYIVNFKRQSNASIDPTECSNITSSAMFKAFTAMGFCVQNGNCIPLGSYDALTLCNIMKTFVSQLTAVGGQVQ